MNLSAARPSLSKTSSAAHVQSGTVYGLIIILAMAAFEIFNFSTTLFALQDLLGSLTFLGIPWATFLALAFCGIDFAGIARLIGPENRKNDLKESWYLFGAWLLAATANAALTWWGVAVAINSHALKSSNVINTQTLLHVVPVFVAILVWVIRILIIGSLTSAIERMNTGKQSSERNVLHTDSFFQGSAPVPQTRASTQPLNMTRNPRQAAVSRPEPTYHNLFVAHEMEDRPAQKNNANPF